MPHETRMAHAELVTPVQDAFDVLLSAAIDRMNERRKVTRTPEQTARARWASWRHLRPRISETETL